MKLLVPLDENRGFSSRISSHFGRAPYYAVLLVEDDKTSFEIIMNPRLQGIRPAELALRLGVDGVVVRGGIGVQALELLRSVKIKVFETSSETLQGLVYEVRKGLLREYSGSGCPGAQSA